MGNHISPHLTYIEINIQIYIDDVLGLEAYKTYDSIVRGILIQDYVWCNPSHTSSFSSLNALHIRQSLEQTIYLFKREAKLCEIKYDEIEHGKTLYVINYLIN